MPRLSPTYRKQLSDTQLDILTLLYLYRFSTSRLIATYLKRSNHLAEQNRIKILEDQGYIAKRYDSSYKLRGRAASYYLTPAGARQLKPYVDNENQDPIITRHLYKEHLVGEAFIEHCQNVLRVCLLLRDTTDDKAESFPKQYLQAPAWSYFIQPSPDAFVVLHGGEKNFHFLLEVFEEQTPYFVLLRRVQAYVRYHEDGSWEETIKTPSPPVLLVLPTNAYRVRLRKRIARELQHGDGDLEFATTTMMELAASQDGRIWQLVDSSDPNPDEDNRDLLNLEELADELG